MTTLVSGVFTYVALLAQVGCFALISAASIRSFRKDRDSAGMMAIRVLSLIATLWLTLLIIRQPIGPWTAGATALIMSILSAGVLRQALGAVEPGTLDVAFTGNGPDRLVTSGIYGHLRNPLYTAYLIFWAGWIPLSVGHPMSVVIGAAFAVIYWLAARQEEAFLGRQFGKIYDEYRARTGRFLPVFQSS